MGYQELAYAIIKQAVYDYREAKLIGIPVNHISRFFNSEWCDTLLGNSKITGKYILKRLKDEPVTK